MDTSFVGRQPIYDNRLDLFGYELLYRRDQNNFARFDDAEQATSDLIVNTFMEIGLENIVGSRLAFINVTGDFFTGHYPLPMSHEQVVLEVLEDTRPEPAVLEGMRSLTEQGYQLALDDFVLQPECVPFLDYATFVKLDVLSMGRDELARVIPMLRNRGLQLIAEKVETLADYAMCKELGFDYYQGFFFSQPDIVHAPSNPANRAVIVSLISQLQNPDIDIAKLEQLIAQDTVLSYRLLRYINCATFGLRREVESIRQAIMLLGLAAVRKWATLLLMSQGGNQKPQELAVMSLVRANMCELLSQRLNGVSGEQAFTTGLFSLLDAILDTPMVQLLDQMPLSLSIKTALLEQEGSLGRLLSDVVSYERGEWNELSDGEIKPADYRMAYLTAVRWADESAKMLLAV